VSVSSHSADSPVPGCTDVAAATGRLWRGACNETAAVEGRMCYMYVACDKAGEIALRTRPGMCRVEYARELSDNSANCIYCMQSDLILNIEKDISSDKHG
jgi:hypothetical protein